MTTPATLSCPYCSGPLLVSKAQFKAGEAIGCEGCGKAIDLNPMVSSYELMLKHPDVFLRD